MKSAADVARAVIERLKVPALPIETSEPAAPSSAA
jgi:hypothetical protein